MKIFLYEIRKLIMSKRFLIIIGAFLIQIAIMFIPQSYEHEYSDEVYKKYINQISGEYTDEKRGFIFNRADEINGIIANHEDVISAYKRNDITLDEFETHNFAYNKALTEQTTVEHLMQKCFYFDGIGRGVFFYDTSWVDFFSNSGYSYIIALVVICLIMPVFDSEYQSNAVSMLLTTRHGKRKICISKLITVALTTFLIAFAIYMLQYATFMFIRGDNAGLGVENLMGYSSFSEISLKRYYINDTLIKSVSWVVAALFICAVSVIARNTVFSFFISFIFIVCPYFISHFFYGNWFGYIFSANQLGQMYTENLNLALLVIAYMIKSTAYSLFCIRKWEEI